MQILFAILVPLSLIVSVGLVLVILIQRPQGGGLSAAFGGGGGAGASQSAFGAKTGDVLTIVTVSGFVAFILISCGLVLATRQIYEGGATTTLPPNPPADVVASVTGPLQVRVEWSDESDDEDGFFVERSQDTSIGWTDVSEPLPVGTEAFNDVTLPAPGTYFYRVASFRTGVTEPSYSGTTQVLVTETGEAPAPDTGETPAPDTGDAPAPDTGAAAPATESPTGGQ